MLEPRTILLLENVRKDRDRNSPPPENLKCPRKHFFEYIPRVKQDIPDHPKPFHTHRMSHNTDAVAKKWLTREVRAY